MILTLIGQSEIVTSNDISSIDKNYYLISGLFEFDKKSQLGFPQVFIIYFIVPQYSTGENQENSFLSS